MELSRLAELLTRSAVREDVSRQCASLCIVFDPELRWLTVMQDASLHKATINHCFPEKIGDAGPSRECTQIDCLWGPNCK